MRNKSLSASLIIFLGACGYSILQMLLFTSRAVLVAWKAKWDSITKFSLCIMAMINCRIRAIVPHESQCLPTHIDRISICSIVCTCLLYRFSLWGSYHLPLQAARLCSTTKMLRTSHPRRGWLSKGGWLVRKQFLPLNGWVLLSDFGV